MIFLTFRPITRPLKELATNAQFKPENAIKLEPKEEGKDYEEDNEIISSLHKRSRKSISPPPKKRKYIKKESTSTPATNYSLIRDDDEFSTPTRSLSFTEQYPSSSSSPLDPSDNNTILKYLKLYNNDSTRIDSVYGVYVKDNQWRIGDSVIEIHNDDNITIKGKTYKVTPGLCELLFTKSPKKDLYSSNDLSNYRNILIDSSAHKRNYDQASQINGNKSYKYTNIIKNLVLTEGKGLMQIHKEKIDYVHWDDPNELVDRLRLLISSQQAGHNNHNNEIQSILEELREADIIV